MDNPLDIASQLVFKQVNKVKEWHELPKYAALLNLRLFRNELRELNLYDTETEALNAAESGGNGGPIAPEDLPKYRTYDGAKTDARYPNMGRAGSRFGRNHPLGMTIPEKPPLLTKPNPRTVSSELLNRDTFKPATTLNVLAAAWIQFENHDWFSHGDNSPDEFRRVPVRGRRDWPDDPMKVRRTTRPDPRRRGTPPTYVNTVTHWWDGSQIYGSDRGAQPQAAHRRGRQDDRRGRAPAERGRTRSSTAST